MENDKLYSQNDELLGKNKELYSQNNELRNQMENFIPKYSRNLSRKRESTRLLSQRLSRSRSSNEDYKLVYECGLLAKENNDLKHKYKNLYDEYQKYKLECEVSKGKLRQNFSSTFNRSHSRKSSKCDEKGCWG
jgi:hypothetical protein